MEECAQMGSGEQFWTDLMGFLSGFGKILESNDGFLYTASARTIMSLSVEVGKQPILLDSLRLSRKIEAMRVFEGRIYINLWANEKLIVDAADPSDLFADGPHDVLWWVKGQKIEGDLVHILDRNAVRIARVIPGGGWAW